MKLLSSIIILCIALISCGEDSSTNAQDNQEFDYSLQNDMQWEYEVNNDGEIRNATWYSSGGDAPDGESALKILVVNGNESIEDAIKYNKYSYLNLESNSVSIYKNSIPSNLINDRIENNSYWEKVIDTDEDSWTIADIEYDSTYSHGLIEQITISITGEFVEEGKIEFQDEERRTITTKITKEIILTSTLNGIERSKITEFETNEYTFMEGVGFYKLVSYRKGLNVNREEIESTVVLQLVDYKLQSQ